MTPPSSVNQTEDLLFTVLVQLIVMILAAGIGGKLIPVYLAGRSAGFDNTQSWMMGTLMNTRGLMELIALNIGYDLGGIPRDPFTMLVIMSVVTNLMAGPILRLLLPRMGHAVPAEIEGWHLT